MARRTDWYVEQQWSPRRSTDPDEGLGSLRVLTIAVLATIVLLIAAGVWAGTARAEEEAYTPSDTLAAIDQASEEIGVPAAYLTRIVGCETGWTFNPYSVGRQGELGAVQLAPWGELRRFKAWGYLDPYSPYQAVRFLAQRITMGGARAWSCA